MAGNARGSLVVLGAGPGGYAAAFRAADLGLDVTLVDRETNPGGVCLYRGCIPSKALLHAARVIFESRDASAFGVEFAPPTIRLERLREWKNSVVTRLTGGLGQLRGARGVRHVQGQAAFRGPNALHVESTSGPADLSFDHAIIATGSSPNALPFLPSGSPRIWDSTAALELREVPGRLLVIGGGYIGLELGTVYAALGSSVSVVEMTPNLLPGADRDLVRPLERRLKSLFASIRLETKVGELTETGDAVDVTFESKEGKRFSERFDRVLVAVGRSPNSRHLGLEHTRVRIDRRGFIQIDHQRRTAEPSIFAIGDVAGEPMLAHKASHEGLLAAEVVAGRHAAWDPQAIPAVVFTDPEIAWCGLSEAAAVAEKRAVRVTRFPWAASGRALTLDRSEGLTKLIVDEDSGRVLGAGIVGAGAGELIAEAVLAIEMGATAEDLALSIHAHPTLSETLMEAAELVEGAATHLFRKGRE